MNAIQTAAAEMVSQIKDSGLDAAITSYSNQSDSTYITVSYVDSDGDLASMQIRVSDHNPGATTGRSDFYVYADGGRWACSHNSYRYDCISGLCCDLIDDIKSEIE